MRLTIGPAGRQMLLQELDGARHGFAPVGGRPGRGNPRLVYRTLPVDAGNAGFRTRQMRNAIDGRTPRLFLCRPRTRRLASCDEEERGVGRLGPRGPGAPAARRIIRSHAHPDPAPQRSWRRSIVSARWEMPGKVTSPSYFAK